MDTEYSLESLIDGSQLMSTTQHESVVLKDIVNKSNGASCNSFTYSKRSARKVTAWIRSRNRKKKKMKLKPFETDPLTSKATPPENAESGSNDENADFCGNSSTSKRSDRKRKVAALRSRKKMKRKLDSSEEDPVTSRVPQAEAERNSSDEDVVFINSTPAGFHDSRTVPTVIEISDSDDEFEENDTLHAGAGANETNALKPDIIEISDSDDDHDPGKDNVVHSDSSGYQNDEISEDELSCVLDSDNEHRLVDEISEGEELLDGESIEDEFVPIKTEITDCEVSSENLKESPKNSKSSILDMNDYNLVCEQVDMSTENLNVLDKFAETLEKVLLCDFPAGKMYPFRLDCLLGDTNSMEMMFFVDFKGTISNGLCCGSDFQYSCFLKETDSKFSRLTLETRLCSTMVQKVLPDLRRNHDPRGQHFVSDPTGFLFSIESDGTLLTEVQTCRLVEYLFSFDPRSRPMMRLLAHWKKKNHIVLENYTTVNYLPPPSPLRWVLALFLCTKNLIPTVKEVLKEPHVHVYVSDNVDVGFSNTEKDRKKVKKPEVSMREGTEEFVFSVLELIKEFFDFCDKLNSGRWLLNTRDGEVIDKDNFLQGNFEDTLLSPEERAAIKNISGLKTCNIFILQPFCVTKCLSYSTSIFTNRTAAVVKDTNRLIEIYIDTYKNGRGVSTDFMTLWNFHDTSYDKQIGKRPRFVTIEERIELERRARLDEKERLRRGLSSNKYAAYIPQMIKQVEQRRQKYLISVAKNPGRDEKSNGEIVEQRKDDAESERVATSAEEIAKVEPVVKIQSAQDKKKRAAIREQSKLVENMLKGD